MSTVHVLPISVRPLDGDEIEFVQGNIGSLTEMFSQLFEEPCEVNSESMDAVYTCWMENFDEAEEDQDDVRGLLAAFSMAFGNQIATDNGLEWGIAQFEDGTEDFTICDAESEIFLYPISMVLKRFDQGETGFFVPLEQVLSKQVSELRQARE